MAVDDAEVGIGKEKKKEKSHFTAGNFGSVYLGRNMIPHLEDGYPYLYPISILLLECRNQREFKS